MPERDGESHLMAACEACGAVYAAMTLPSKRIVPIGTRDGCGSCGGTEFTPLTTVADSLDPFEDETEE
jgi:uncharacterized Zn finger protein